ncbi:proton-coupled amino acid transporter 1 isoform X1 [Hydra vulgaris]|uniref:proton-coupled amino acid transporter 1 isoform X1 n=1 Tax=Hydra vulgaris TaxID=6087 RepID=UPI001F5E38D2|nr:proton-coupled amino acid transporter 1-like [Hydra vulgaris]
MEKNVDQPMLVDQPILLKTFLCEEPHETFQSEDELDNILEEKFFPKEGHLEDWQVLTHLLKVFIGTGILGLPSAVMHGGLMLGPAILLLLGSVCMYNIKLLVDTAQNIRESLGIKRISYSGISEYLFSVYGKRIGMLARYVTDCFLCTLQLGFCCVYVVFISHNLQAAAHILDVRIWMVIIFPFLLVLSLSVNIKKLAYLTMSGNVIALIGLGVIYQYLFSHIQLPLKLPNSNGAINACVAFGQIIYAFEGIAVVLPTENKLKTRESFRWILQITGCLVMFLYFSFAVLGYLTFGDKTMGSISLNLPQTWLYQVLQLLYSLMVYFTYPLQLLVSVEIINSYCSSPKEPLSKLQEYLLRSSLVVTTCIFAVFIPQLDHFMSLVGSVSGVAVGLILPPILHTICYWNQGLSNISFVINIMIVIFGLFVSVVGTVSTVYSIMQRYTNLPHSTKPIGKF